MRKLLPLILILGFIVPIQPANAIFGLSKCEKVKKGITATETKLNNNISYLNANIGKPIGGFALTHDKIDANIQSIWKTGFNNPTCFTNSQKLQIKKLKNTSSHSFVEIDGNFTWVSPNDKQKACTPTEKVYCDMVQKYWIKSVSFYSSIYSY